MVKTFLWVVTAFLLSTLACATSTNPCPGEVARNFPAVVNIVVGGQGLISGEWDMAEATGIILGKGNLILTCGHLFWRRDSEEDRLSLRVLVVEAPELDEVSKITLRDLQTCRENPVVDTVRDLALLRLASSISNVTVRFGEIAVDQSVWIVGYAERTELKIIRGVVEHVLGERVYILPEELPVPGMSGSPVFSEEGDLVAIVVAVAGGKYVVATKALGARELQKQFECEQGTP